MIYTMECGCEFRKEDFESHDQFLCPVHNKKTLYRTVRCANCNAPQVVNKQGQPPQYCNDCKKLLRVFRANFHKKHSRAATQEEVDNFFLSPHKRQFDKFRDESKRNCVDHVLCLGRHWNFDSMPCGICAFYKLAA